MDALPTMFAPAERAAKQLFTQESQLFSYVSPYFEMMDSVPDIVLLLNKQRQVVHCNKSAQNFFGTQDRTELYGMRPGEILRCAHAFETEGGCGTTEFCRTCGAVKAILSSQAGHEDCQECRIVQKDTGDALDLRVWTRPIHADSERFTIVSVIDISSEKRKQVLERIFFHDIMNTVGGLRGMAELIREVDSDTKKELEEDIYRLSERLVDEINAQKTLVAAENNELKCYPSIVHPVNIMKQVVEGYQHHQVGKKRILIIDDGSVDVAFESDAALLFRVVSNMVKNALEATGAGKSVTIGSHLLNGKIQFWVHNDEVIPRDIQLQLFQRSFSTKGMGRGIGTYSMKFLSERYLHGCVEFTSSVETGTIFTATFPLHWREK
jgi:nitrogen fixation/metabolism regulation signal transduction histidine kinase